MTFQEFSKKLNDIYRSDGSWEDRCGAAAAFIEPYADAASDLGVVAVGYKEITLDCRKGARDLRPIRRETIDFSYRLPDGSKSMESWANPNFALAAGYFHMRVL